MVYHGNLERVTPALHLKPCYTTHETIVYDNWKETLFSEFVALGEEVSRQKYWRLPVDCYQHKFYRVL